MDNYEINILSEEIFQFSAGGIYLVELKFEMVNKDVLSSDYALYLNYPFDLAKKIVPSFEQLGTRKQKRILKSIQEDYGYKIRVDDAFGQLIVLLFFNIGLYNLLIVGLVGLGDNAINDLIEIGKKLITNKKDKTIILTKISDKLYDRVCVTKL